MQEVQAICNRVVIINKGQIVADDSIERLQQNQTGETAILVEFRPDTSKSQLQKIKGVKEVTGEATKWRIKGREGLQETIFQFAVANQLTIVSLTEEKQSLEEVFKELTKEHSAKSK
jgi:ABC-2 type transport system ATP-binding protein